MALTILVFLRVLMLLIWLVLLIHSGDLGTTADGNDKPDGTNIFNGADSFGLGKASNPADPPGAVDLLGGLETPVGVASKNGGA